MNCQRPNDECISIPSNDFDILVYLSVIVISSESEESSDKFTLDFMSISSYDSLTPSNF